MLMGASEHKAAGNVMSEDGLAMLMDASEHKAAGNGMSEDGFSHADGCQ